MRLIIPTGIIGVIVKLSQFSRVIVYSYLAIYNKERTRVKS